ncbi:hypothetical protein IQ273_19500 [Nodosilinea sp. LEGE 07298]|uniref:hypothetical protein n=1 Tax=Nodosilinea sp. LEGE 07298 TaxID=2777970 RepID=UPI00188079C4|nr:hypothetical protein [Nodosilinea sp. LEGE 07298]MBE9111595.1 hypothetical protein [Nodosilinea sp. LEGE 07298]
MTQAKVISVNDQRQIDLPEDILQTLNPGDEYLVWQTGDRILLQKIQKPSTFDALMAKVESLGPDPDQLSMDDITTLVKDVRREIAAQAPQE